jgi:hypothetical protein
MKFDDKHSFGKPAATVIKMFGDRSYFERKYKEVGAWDIEVLEHEKTDKQFRIKVRYTMKSEAGLPDFAKKFIGDSSVITQTDAWDLVKKTGRIEAEIKGAPVKVSAEMSLRDEGQGSANLLKWTVSCGIPLLGGKLEKIISEDIQAKSRNDLAVSRKLLAGY